MGPVPHFALSMPPITGGIQLLHTPIGVVTAMLKPFPSVLAQLEWALENEYEYQKKVGEKRAKKMPAFDPACVQLCLVV